MKAFHLHILYKTCVLLFFLTSCSTIKDIPDLKALYSANQISSFALHGKIAFITAQERQSSNLYWQQKNERYELNLTTFLGIQLAEVVGTPNHLFVSADGKTYQSNSPEQLIEETIGWPVPISHLQNWIKGVHNGVIINRHDNKQAKEVLVRTSSTEEWTLNYLSYKKYGNIYLPTKIKCQSYGLTVILQINEWENINQ
ncbi:lipoprotein insertase outer membrane protein LolB [Catenovulum sediminis]|uniref:Outer-membrane lipoprotein LolB n=1 Tax=Catenovulum sediminis TaxID=1740262 RepID=A0ABV1RKS7_9ALTE|nr:lipoprotein insertase outer membrane protein LolB [Catenovulum sediminis]